MHSTYTNRLINEKSPYLLQHANNPVDWFPWGDEAFAKAKAEDKPVFLSIGYSTCHWCHVMERESFEDEEVAALLNERYISIKVDREERPDIDTIYMSVCQAITGHGGWPLTVIMTPDKKPFYAGTYFPKQDSRGMPGLMTVLKQLATLWEDRKDELVSSGDKITEAIEQHMFSHTPGQINEGVFEQLFRYYEENFDSRYGGFGSAPKFPTAHNLSFLLRYWKSSGDGAALEMVEKTLEAMYRGGLYDHIGFGFTRYSTDRRWLVPHFEKMLYDNALLAIAYLETYQAAGKEFYASVARDIFTYVLRDMTSPEGGFYSAEDADSEGIEGKFYLWSPEEIKEVLGDNLGKHFCEDYDITSGGNFEGKSIPNLIGTGLVRGYADAREKLFRKREERLHPFKDDKILTSWNGLMIAALALGARILREPEYKASADKAAHFVISNLRREDGRLLARYRDGHSAFLGYLEDYAYFIWGLLELYQTTFEIPYLELALELNKDLLKYFWDEKEGGLFHYGSDAENLISRPKEIYDGAMPSGNSVAALNFLRLARLTKDQELEGIARKQLAAFGGSISNSPPGHAFFLMAAWFEITAPVEISIVQGKDRQALQEVLNLINSKFLPEAVIGLKTAGNSSEQELLPMLQGKSALEGQSTVYVCKDFSCRPAVTKPDDLEKIFI